VSTRTASSGPRPVHIGDPAPSGLLGNAQYDPECDCLAVDIIDAPYDHSAEVGNVILDFDALGRVIGVEVLSVTHLPLPPIEDPE
jgi:uncharacterized protein YuzE